MVLASMMTAAGLEGKPKQPVLRMVLSAMFQMPCLCEWPTTINRAAGVCFAAKRAARCG